MSDDRRGFATRAVHAPPARLDQQPSSVPIHLASTFRFETSEDYAETIAFRRPGSTYSRGYGNPTVESFEAAIADLEGTEAALGFASGMAAIHAVFTAAAGAGQRIVASRELYGGTYSLFTRVAPRYGIQVDLVDPHDHAAVAAALPGAALLYVETMANPNVTVADLERLGAIAVEAGVPAVAPRWTREGRIHATAHFLRDDGHRLPLEVLVVAEAAEEIIIQRAVADRQPPWFENHEADWRTAHAAVADEQRAVPLPDLPALPVTAARLAPACPAEPADTPVNQNRSMQW